ncbi:MAG TPA: hypothetical protein VFZ65_19880 [Planctomycetota bacterium]|nr:hypothetical protein [Planctomycetota bacterium]
MKRPLIRILPVLFVAPLCAQKVELKAASQEKPQQFHITTKFQTTDARKMLINGEEPGAGGGRGGFGGGGGESSLSQAIEFVEGPGGAWREYSKLSATESRPGQDGETRETAVQGALQGKKVFVKKAADGSVTLTEGEGEKAEPVDAALSRGVPATVSFAGFVPGKAVAPGESFDLPGFSDSLRGLLHPVTPERTQGGRGGRGQGGQGGQGGEGGQGGRGQGGAQGGRGARGGRFGMGAGSTVVDLIGAGKLNVDAKGKLIGVEEKDGHQIASIEVTAKLAGKGKSADFGLQAGMGGFGRGGRGGQGGGQAADNGTDNVDAGFEIKGKVTFDVAEQRVVGVDLAGNVKIDRETKRTMQDRNGEDQTMESTTNTKGKFEVQASSGPAAK